MTLTNLLGNKIHALVLGAVLTACGDEPDNVKYVINTDKDKERVCQDLYQHMLDCDGFALSNNPEAKKNKILSGCLKDGHLYPAEFYECMFNECGPHMLGNCDLYIDDIGKQ